MIGELRFKSQKQNSESTTNSQLKFYFHITSIYRSRLIVSIRGPFYDMCSNTAILVFMTSNPFSVLFLKIDKCCGPGKYIFLFFFLQL